MKNISITSSTLSFPLIDSEEMDIIFLKLMLLFVSSTLLISSRPCYSSDTNEIRGYVCSGSDKATAENEYQVNLNNLLTSFAANGATNNGFYTATVGKHSNHKIYGLTQCRGDLPATNCATCIKNATAYRTCSTSKTTTIWFTWCSLRYSNASFLGVSDGSAMASVNDTDFDDPNLASDGFQFMTGLASTAPVQPLMFQVAVLDVKQSGKRYGMAQCSRDISRRDCRRCLDSQLTTFRTSIGNKRGWEIYGSTCSMWYHDYQFYFNFTIPTNGGVTRFSPDIAGIGKIIATLVLLINL